MCDELGVSSSPVELCDRQTDRQTHTLCGEELGVTSSPELMYVEQSIYYRALELYFLIAVGARNYVAPIHLQIPRPTMFHV